MKHFSFLFLFITTLSFSQANVYSDSSFGDNGELFPSSNNIVDLITLCKTIQSVDNKLIITNGYRSLSKHNLDGTVDLTFGNSGTLTVSFPTNDYRIRDLSELSDGCILILINNSAYSYILKYKPDGSVDNSFGVNGSQPILVNSYYNRFNKIEVLDDDSILLAGIADTTVVGVVKMDKNGHYDTSFGLDGIVTITTVDITYDFFGLDTDSDHNIYIGYSNYGNSIYVKKLNPSGIPVSNFGNNSIASYNSPYPKCKDLKIFPNGKILIAANYNGAISLNDVFLIVFNPDGFLDTSLGDGTFRYDLQYRSNDIIEKILLVDNDTFYLAGRMAIGGINSGLLVKLNKNFALDMTFNYSGIYTFNFFNFNYSEIYDILLQRDKKIVLSGRGDFNTSIGIKRLFDTKLLSSNENIKTNNVSINPNPASDFINIQSENVLLDKSFEITEMTGKSVIKNKLLGKSINISSLKTGIYILKIDNKSYKFIKK